MSQSITVLRHVGGFVFDATYKETHKLGVDVTTTPVESGAPITDHARRKQAVIVITAAVTNTPLRVAQNDQWAAPYGRASRCFDIMRELMDNLEPVTIQTGLAAYRNMMCTDLDTSQDKSTAGVLVFNATFTEVRIGSTQKVTYPTRKAGKTKQQADAKKKQGQKQGTDLTEKTASGATAEPVKAEKSKSTLKKLLG